MINQEVSQTLTWTGRSGHHQTVMTESKLLSCLICSVAFVCPSDDELTPYDMSGDQEMSRASPPRYLRDCLECTAPFIQTLTFFLIVTQQEPGMMFACLSSDTFSINVVRGLGACGAQPESC